jgi:NADPH:quinone reductase-like Zn-dependent oxidoreductase
VLIRAVATSINPVDDKTREGAIGEGTPPLPMTLGWDLAGIVVDGGKTGLGAGERVIGMSHQLGTVEPGPTWSLFPYTRLPPRRGPSVCPRPPRGRFPD